MYISKYYTNPEIDERLLQGYYDDLVKAGFTGSINELWRMILSITEKVDKKEGYGLSKNDFTDELLKKLEGISEGAKLITKVSQLENDLKFQTEEDVKATISSLVDGADDALDTLKELAEALNNDPNFATNITNKLTEVRTALNEEVTRATTEEGKLSSSISELRALLEQEVEKINNTVAANFTALNEADARLNEKINDNAKEIVELSHKIDLNKNEDQAYAKGLVDAEKDRATAAEQLLSEKVAFISNQHVTDKADLQSQITKEISDRQQADTTLQSSLTDSVSELKSEDTKLYQSLSNEKGQRTAADSALQSNIDTEANTRAEADNNLSSRIDSEASNRKNADDLLQYKIDDLTTIQSNDKATLDTKIEKEITDRKDADTALDNKKVDKREGYSLTKNDFTDILLAKLNEIEEKANYITQVSQLINDSGYQTSTEVQAAIEKVIGSAPEVLDTLEEIAKALGDDPNFASTITKKLTAVTEDLNQEKEDRAAGDEAVKTELTQKIDALSTLTGENLSNLSERLSEEVLNRKESDTALQGKITEETNLRKESDTLLQSNLDRLSSTLTASVAEVKQGLVDLNQNLTTRINGQDSLIKENSSGIQRNLELIQGIQSTISGQYIELKTRLDEEVARAKAAEAALEAKIQDNNSALEKEIEDRKAADEALQMSITKEVEDRTAADTALDTKFTKAISDEATARAEADTTLQGKLDTETQTRQQADTNLQSQITKEVSDREAADTAISERVTKNATDLASEVTRATNAEKAIKDLLDTTIENHSDDITAINGTLDTMNKKLNQEITDRAAADTNLQTSINELSTDLNAFKGTKGKPDGLATLDGGGKIPFEQIPGEIGELYGLEQFVANPAALDTIQPAPVVGDMYYVESTKKIYIKTAEGWDIEDPKQGKTLYNRRGVDDKGRTNVLHRFDGNNMVEVSESLVLGEEAGTAYPGDKGKQNADNITDLTKKVNDLTTGDSEINNRLEEEIRNRTAADDNLQSQITKEISDRKDADNLINTALTKEITDRAAADTTLQANIDEETSLRIAGDNALQDNLDDESAARLNKDTELETSISTLTTNWAAIKEFDKESTKFVTYIETDTITNKTEGIITAGELANYLGYKQVSKYVSLADFLFSERFVYKKLLTRSGSTVSGNYYITFSIQATVEGGSSSPRYPIILKATYHTPSLVRKKNDTSQWLLIDFTEISYHALIINSTISRDGSKPWKFNQNLSNGFLLITDTSNNGNNLFGATGAISLEDIKRFFTFDPNPSITGNGNATDGLYDTDYNELTPDLRTFPPYRTIHKKDVVEYLTHTTVNGQPFTKIDNILPYTGFEVELTGYHIETGLPNGAIIGNSSHVSNAIQKLQGAIQEDRKFQSSYKQNLAEVIGLTLNNLGNEYLLNDLSSTNYLVAVTQVVEALKILDAKIKEKDTQIANLQKALDTANTKIASIEDKADEALFWQSSN